MASSHVNALQEQIPDSLVLLLQGPDGLLLLTVV